METPDPEFGPVVETALREDQEPALRIPIAVKPPLEKEVEPATDLLRGLADDIFADTVGSLLDRRGEENASSLR
ncbi:MAG: hypothetical protein SF066_03725 [Thermoanaerobaculia bacterium]|nr:hypothetical protein [Thermoanaerobaculia bacterium]